MGKILLPYAYNSLGELIHIDASKGEIYTCPTCGAELSLRISKIPKGEKYHRTNHFAHKGSSDNHCSESFLHNLFKERTADYIRDKLSRKEDITFKWQCSKCHEEHEGNLLKKAVEVVVEYNMGECKPDIALLDITKKAIIVIEVVVSHKPEPQTLQFYDDNKIACLQIFVSDFEDCNKVEEKLTRPEGVNMCPKPVCSICGHIMDKEKIVTVIADCWNCGNKMTIAMKHGLERYSPKDFNNEEVAIATSVGANIKKCFSKNRNESYLANVCSHCGSFVGDYYIHYDCDYDDYPYEEEIDLGYKCFNCQIEKENKEREKQQEENRKKSERYMELKQKAHEKTCPKCGGNLRLISSYNGMFYGCTNYPNCRYTESIVFD